jgi:hypothetical protein
MLAHSPLADRLASRLVREPPMLGAFGALKRSRTGLIVGIVVAWALGDVLEEVALHGVVLGRCETLLSHWFAPWLAALAAICLAAALSGVIHLYQGRRGALIVAQLSVLFGVCDQRTRSVERDSLPRVLRHDRFRAPRATAVTLLGSDRRPVGLSRRRAGSGCYFANTSSAILVAASSCIAGMACE